MTQSNLVGVSFSWESLEQCIEKFTGWASETFVSFQPPAPLIVHWRDYQMLEIIAWWDEQVFKARTLHGYLPIKMRIKSGKKIESLYKAAHPEDNEEVM